MKVSLLMILCLSSFRYWSRLSRCFQQRTQSQFWS